MANDQDNQQDQPGQQDQPTQPAQTNQSPAKKGYGKRPLWQWILLYVIVGGVIYAAIYFFYFHKGYNSAGSNTTQSAPY